MDRPTIVLNKRHMHMAPHYEAAGFQVRQAQPLPKLQALFDAAYRKRERDRRQYPEPLA